ncbi:MAG TPA: hypothetical protein DDZ51_22365 [Planctomycetaceae bacterium]|nr:hypothetical protein [Planctomycetaceae bacterium]
MATDWGVHNSITSQINPGGASVSSKLELIVVFRVTIKFADSIPIAKQVASDIDSDNHRFATLHPNPQGF